jgi:hypothetical protein
VHAETVKRSTVGSGTAYETKESTGECEA